MEMENPQRLQILAKLNEIQSDINALRFEIQNGYDEYEIVEEPVTEEDLKIIERNERDPNTKYIPHEEVKKMLYSK